MKHFIYSNRIKRKFRKNGNLYLCQFRFQGESNFTTECKMNEPDEAMSYVSLVVRFFNQVSAGKVLNSETQAEVFTCHRLISLETLPRRFVRETTTDYGQLALVGFDAKAVQKTTAKQKRKIEETLAKLRQLHEELNAQLYARPTERPSVHTPSDAAIILQPFIGGLDHEELWVIDLDTRNRVMSLIALYKGSVNSSQVRVAEIFRHAIVDNAPAIIVAHNHPSGDSSPSPEDVAVTRAIVQAGKLLDIDVLDHIVVSQGGFTSLKERGLGFS